MRRDMLCKLTELMASSTILASSHIWFIMKISEVAFTFGVDFPYEWPRSISITLEREREG